MNSKNDRDISLAGDAREDPAGGTETEIAMRGLTYSSYAPINAGWMHQYASYSMMGFFHAVDAESVLEPGCFDVQSSSVAGRKAAADDGWTGLDGRRSTIDLAAAGRPFISARGAWPSAQLKSLSRAQRHPRREKLGQSGWIFRGGPNRQNRLWLELTQQVGRAEQEQGQGDAATGESHQGTVV